MLISMEEQRAIQEQEARRVQAATAGAETSTARPETINKSKLKKYFYNSLCYKKLKDLLAFNFQLHTLILLIKSKIIFYWQ